MNERPREEAPTPTRCARCDTSFGCGARLDTCWCQQLPPLESARLAASTGCYCPDCLAALVAEQERAR